MTPPKHSAPALVAAALLALGCATTATPGSRTPLPGVRFAIDTVGLPAPARGALETFAGVVELTDGRGRLDVVARRGRPVLAVRGVTIGAPLASPGDYYLFDSTGFVLVRPASRTFSSFALSRASWRHGDVREPDEGFVEMVPLRADTLADGDSARLARHGPVTIRWHLDRRHASGPASVLARGWLDLRDAPAGEASVARWFGAARALATMPGGLGTLPPDSLRVTAIVVLKPADGRSAPVNLIVVHPLSGVAPVAIDPARLVLPVDYTETPWPGLERVSGVPAPSRDAAARWRTMPGETGR